MEKQHPFEVEEDRNVGLKGRKLEDLAGEVTKNIESDLHSRQGYSAKLRKWYRRRHQLEFQKPNFPFRGASKFTPPLIDIEVEKSKPPIMNLYQSNPLVTFNPMNRESVQKADAAEEQFQWLLLTRMEGFLDNMEIGADKFGQDGSVIFKTYYEWRSRMVREVVQKDRFSESDREAIAVAASFLEQAKSGGLQQAATPEEQEQMQTQLQEAQRLYREFFMEEFGLSNDDPTDKKSIKQLEKFFTTDQKKITIKKKEVYRDAPHVEAMEPMAVIPAVGTKRIEDAERITEIKFYSRNDIAMRAADGFFDEKAAKFVMDKIEENAGSMAGRETNVHTSLRIEKDQHEGVNRTTEKEDLIEVDEHYFHYDIDNDGIEEKCVMMIQPDTNAVLKFMELPYNHGQWPFIQIKREMKDNRETSSRGIPEVLDQTDREVIFNHRMKANAMMIANAPTFKFKITSNINPANFNWIPGQFYPVNDMGDIEPMLVPHVDGSLDNEENILVNWVERRMGSVDSALTRQGSLTEPRTKSEVDLIASIGQQNLSLTLSRWQRGMKRLYDMIWDLWMQFGPVHTMVRTSKGKVTPMTRFQVQGDFDIVPMGTVGNSNPSLLANRAMQRVQFLMQFMQMGGDQVMQQGGRSVDMAAAVFDAFTKDDYVMATKIFPEMPPQLLQQAQQQQAAQAQEVQAAQANRPMSLERLENVQKNSPFGKDQQVAT